MFLVAHIPIILSIKVAEIPPSVRIKERSEILITSPILISLEAIKVFLDTSPESLSILNKKFEEQDFPGIHKAAHKLKTTIDIMKIDSLHDTIRSIEGWQADSVGDASLKEMIASINTTFELIYPRIREELYQIEYS